MHKGPLISCLVAEPKSGNKVRANNRFEPMMASPAAITVSDIRSALHSKRFRHQKLRPGTLVIDELGLAHARSRVDVAVINGCIHGYEIKSAQDSLDRLGGQIAVYRQALQKVTIVAAQRHLRKVMVSVPHWCGLIEVMQGARGGIQLQTIRSARMNPEINPVMVAHLLWRPEVLELLSRIGCAPKQLRGPRKYLYETLCEAMTLREITAAIQEFMVRRQTWRDHPAHA
jgi:hypothetical protein